MYNIIKSKRGDKMAVYKVFVIKCKGKELVEKIKELHAQPVETQEKK